ELSATLESVDDIVVEPRQGGEAAIWAVGGSQIGPPRLARWIRNPSGALVPAGIVGLPSGSERAIALGDLDGDGVLDAVVHPAFGAAGTSIAIVRSTEDGRLEEAIPFALGSPSWTLGETMTGFAITDLDGDGLGDLLFSCKAASDRLLFIRNESR